MKLHRLVAAVAVVVLGATAACSTTADGPSSSPSASYGTPAALPGGLSAVRIPPAGQAYLGAYVDPDRFSTAPTNKQTQAATFQQQIGRSLGILHGYVAFTSLRTPAAVNSAVGPLAANGSTPLLSWGCPSALPSSLTDPAFTSVVTQTADALKAYGKPVLLRYGWEVNIASRALAVAGCTGTQNREANYIAMWRAVVDTFRARHVDNVSFVWCAYADARVTNWAAFFPGAQWVDWIAADGYDHTDNGAAAFTNQFSQFYATYSGLGKPLMIAETGADQHRDQAAYLTSLATVLPNQYPAIKALVYFDAPGENGSWQLTPGTAGMTAFTALGKSAYFGYMSPTH